MARSFLALLFVASIVLTLAGCGSNDSSPADVTDKAKGVAQTQEAAQAKDGVKSE